MLIKNQLLIFLTFNKNYIFKTSKKYKRKILIKFFIILLKTKIKENFIIYDNYFKKIFTFIYTNNKKYSIKKLNFFFFNFILKKKKSRNDFLYLK